MTPQECCRQSRVKFVVMPFVALLLPVVLDTFSTFSANLICSCISASLCCCCACACCNNTSLAETLPVPPDPPFAPFFSLFLILFNFFVAGHDALVVEDVEEVEVVVFSLSLSSLTTSPSSFSSSSSSQTLFFLLAPPAPPALSVAPCLWILALGLCCWTSVNL